MNQATGLAIGDWTANPADQQYLSLMQEILTTGDKRKTRSGDTRALFSKLCEWELEKSLPILTTKKVFWESVVGELLWFLDAGRNSPVPYRMSLKKLAEYINQKKAAAMWGLNQNEFDEKNRTKFNGDCGRIYGAQWRNWNGQVDQIKNLIEGLKKDPAGRYHLVTAWNPAELDEMCLPPCHMFFQCFVRNTSPQLTLDLTMIQRSCDFVLGVPFNILSYAILQSMLAQCVGMKAGKLKILFQDVHLYEKHIEEGAVTTQLARNALAPDAKLWLNPDITDIDTFTMSDIKVYNYGSHPWIRATLS